MKRLMTRQLLSAIAAILCLSGGCTMSDNMMAKIRHQDAVEVKIPYDDDQVEVKVTPSLNSHCVLGVKHFKNEDWALAKTELLQAVQESPKDHQAHFALGVACEKLGDVKEAFEHYKAANFYGPGVDAQYDAGRRRAEDKLKKSPQK